MRDLANFLNHGILPFVGRERELARLLQFWERTSEAPGLRLSLMVGEAGGGKSRLVDELIPRVTRAGGVVAHVKLYPGSTTALSPLIAQSLWFSAAGRRLLRKEPSPTIASVVDALKRIGRLRPTLLAIEDIHLLGEEATRELSTLLDELSDETLSVLCTTRPIERPVRAVIERYLVDRIDLTALDIDAVVGLWRELTGIRPDPTLAARLHDATLGNPLALRSALRVVIHTGPDDTRAIDKELERSVRLLSEGMTVHLTEEERRDVTRLAALGEIFSREAAEAIGLADQLNILLFKGVIVTVSTPVTLLGGDPSASVPLGFTHSLVHKHFVEGEKPEVELLTRIIVSVAPLYSLLPFFMLAERLDDLRADRKTLDQLIQMTTKVMSRVDYTPDWEMTKPLYDVLEAIASVPTDRTDEEERELQALLLTTRLSIMRREEYTEIYKELTDRMLEVTKEAESKFLLRQRVNALMHRHRYFWRNAPDRCVEVWNEVESLIERHPEMRRVDSYYSYIRDVAQQFGTIHTMPSQRTIEERVRVLAADPDVTPDLREFMQLRVAPYFLRLIESEEELELRIRQMEEFDASTIGTDPSYLSTKVIFLDYIGRFDEAIATADASNPRFAELGLTRSYTHTWMVKLCAQLALGMEFDTALAKAKELAEEANPAVGARFRENTVDYFAVIGALRGQYDWGHRTAAHLDVDPARLLPEDTLDFRNADREQLCRIIDAPYSQSNLKEISQAIIDGRREPLDEFREGLLSTVLCREELLTRLVAIDIMRTYGAVLLPDVDIDAEMRVALLCVLEWCQSKNAFTFILAQLDHYADLLPKREIEEWRARAREIAARYEMRAAVEEEHAINLSMLGTIEVKMPSGERIKASGARIKSLLGVLVADQMLSEPLTHREFCRIASGIDEGPERARKTLNGAVHRLREQFGTDIVLTDKETPRLNLDLVRVDLLDAHRQMREAAASVRSGVLMRAQPLLLSALRTLKGEVPFPGLYDNFFEALREDLEFELREAVIDVASELLRSDDHVGAEELLRAAFTVLGDDKDIVDLLYDALARGGKRVEAERIRMKAV